MGDDGLHLGPTALAPGAKDPSDLGDRLARKILIPLSGFLLVILIVFYVLFDFGRISGPSMLPTLRNDDLVLLTKGDSNPRRGDIVFTSVTEQGSSVPLVKRVIAVPGDTIAIRLDAAIVNGVPEPQRGQVVMLDFAGSAGPMTVPPNTVYLMGDNRADSTDSRDLGPEPISGITGRVVAIYGPVTRIRLVP